ncbi:MAG TPA: MFS transporter [Patescibacteria group bacterium]|nr:MFS transporter [Patescibacteria group bacterium]
MEKTTSTGFWRLRYSVLILIICGWMFSFLDRMVMSLALPFVGKEFQLDATAQGAILSAFFAGYALFQIPGGFLADKFGSRKTMAVGITWWSIFTTITGAVASFPLMLGCRFVFGLGEGCFPGASFKAIATYFPNAQKGTAMAITGTINTLGPALASLIGAGIIAYYGWRTVFVVLGVPGLFIAALIWWYYKDNPAEHPHMTPEELEELDPAAGPRAAGEQLSYLDVLKSPVLWQMMIIWFLFTITFWGFVSWLPSYLMKVRGFSLIKTGIVGSLPFFVGTVGSLLGGYLSDYLKSGRKWLFIVSSALSAVFLYLTFTVASADMAVVYQCAGAFCLLFALSSLWGIIIKQFPARIMGSASGTINVGSQLAGFISPLVMGYLIDLGKGSFDGAFLFIICAVSASALLAITIREPKAD